jgi:hypothetical protein
LPEDGPVRLGPVPLPAGRRVMAVEGGGQPVAWVTGVDVPDPGWVWSALSGLRGQTGLVPVLLDGAEDDGDYFFFRPADTAEIDRLDAATTLAALWDGQYQDTSGPAVLLDAPLSNRFLGLDRPPPGGHSLGDIAAAILKVMTDPAANAELERLNQIDQRNAVRQPAGPGEPGHREAPEPFPGLAPAAGRVLTQAEREAALGALQPSRIGLVPARRPADVPATVGWVTFGVDPYEFGPVQVSANAVWVGSVLRSFEDRFGASLLHLGPGAELRLLVERPPRTLEHAAMIAAEHSVFCDECAGAGLREVSGIAAALVGAPIWTFWWD